MNLKMYRQGHDSTYYVVVNEDIDEVVAIIEFVGVLPSFEVPYIVKEFRSRLAGDNKAAGD